MNGVTNVNSETMLVIRDKFHVQNIEMPYSKRDLHLRTPFVKNLDDMQEAARG